MRLAARQGALGVCSPVGLVRFLLDDSRAPREIAPLFDGCALVVVYVDSAGQLDEIAVEGLHGFLLADPVLDIPQALVDIVQCALIGGNVARRATAVTPGFLEESQFEADV